MVILKFDKIWMHLQWIFGKQIEMNYIISDFGYVKKV